MPSKAQRAASRQARLSRRRRRGKPAPQNFQAGPTQPNAAVEPAVDGPSPSVRRAASISSRSPESASVENRSASRARRRSMDSGTSNTSRYLSRELRQIGIITSLIAVILVGLTFVLG